LTIIQEINMKAKIEGFILFGRYDWERGRAPYFRFNQWDSLDGFVTVQPHSFEVDVPDNFDPRPAMVKKLEAERERVRADFAARITEIDSQIRNLLAIESNAEAV
jgi:hypothetical protein